MAALVQTYTQQSSTATILQVRGTPNSGIMSGGQSHPNHQYGHPSNQAPRSAYNATSGGPSAYRGSNAPLQPYAFSTAPNASQGLQWPQHQQPQQQQQQHHHHGYRANPSSAIPAAQSFDPALAHRSSHRQNASVTNMALLSSYAASQGLSRDELTASHSRPALQSRQSHSSLASQTLLSIPGQSPRKESDRHRRSSLYGGHPARVANISQHPPSGSKSGSGSGSGSGSKLSSSRSVPNLSAYSHAAVDPSNVHHRPSSDDLKKMRRRSVHSINAADAPRPALKVGDSPRPESATPAKHAERTEKTPRVVPLPPKASSHSRNASSDSVSSSRSTHSRTPSSSNRAGPSYSTNTSSNSSERSVKSGQPKTSVPPPRSSSVDGLKRTINPSPLSKPATMANNNESRSASSSPAPAAMASVTSLGNLSSPAAKQLAAINQKGAKPKSKTSRLRRAFSFGSAAEFREAASASDAPVQSQSTKAQKDAAPEPAAPDADQACVAEAQEAGGIGNNIYGGRSYGSTDNLSISSTASSASIMIRKMGRGVKSRTRSLVGLFRPKSGSGVAAADSSAPDTSEPAVTMVHVEAEAQRVNVMPEPRSTRAGKGGIGSPHSERNSLDASQVPDLGSERLGSSGTENSTSRKSILGGDRERAEVLAAVRKGILKRAASPSVRPIDSPGLVLPSVPTISDSPNSSAPSTPVDDAQGHRRAGSIAIGHEDYFMSALRLRQDSRSRPETPQAVAKRNATFSPRIVFHDTWPSQEYDRRGEVATCNRLTPLLAQQIKEELNSFKMEMEVHENSKIYTHFF